MKKILWLLPLVLLGAGCEPEPPCLKGHMEQRHRERYTTIVPAGKTIVPITHPARDWEEFICDEYPPTKGSNK